MRRDTKSKDTAVNIPVTPNGIERVSKKETLILDALRHSEQPMKSQPKSPNTKNDKGKMVRVWLFM
jgi:hypothetical protein